MNHFCRAAVGITRNSDDFNINLRINNNGYLETHKFILPKCTSKEQYNRCWYCVYVTHNYKIQQKRIFARTSRLNLESIPMYYHIPIKFRKNKIIIQGTGIPVEYESAAVVYKFEYCLDNTIAITYEVYVT